jgi:hypothetical protein
MERKFERKTEDKPLTELGDRSKPKDFDLGEKTINKKDKEKNK